MRAICEDCGRNPDLFPPAMIAAEYGDGAFMGYLCDTCDHRRWYRAQLHRRLEARANPDSFRNTVRELAARQPPAR